MAKKKSKKGNAIAKSTKKTSNTFKSALGTVSKTSNTKLTALTGTITNNNFNYLKNTQATAQLTAQDVINNYNESVTKASTTINNISSDSTIFFNHDRAKSAASKIDECATDINRDNTELNGLLQDLSDFWKGSKETEFADKMSNLIDLINSYKEVLNDSVEQLDKGSKAYGDFDEYFATQTI